MKKTVLKYKGYTAVAVQTQKGDFVADVKEFPGKFQIHALSITEVKSLFQQFVNLDMARKRKLPNRQIADSLD